MIRANTVSDPSNQSKIRRIVAFVIAALAIIGLTSTGAPTRATAAAALATVNWGTTYTDASPMITNTRISYDGPSFSIPLSDNVIAGKITTFSGQLSFKTKPSRTNWVVFLCADAANTQCANVSPTGSWVGSNLWPVPANSSFAGFPAYTVFHYVISLNDGGSGTIHPVLNPSLNPVNLETQINYTY